MDMNVQTLGAYQVEAPRDVKQGFLRRNLGKVGAAVSVCSAWVGSQAMAAVDTTAVDTALDAAQASGEGVGTKVITVVAALVVIGIIIAIVKKA